MALLTASLLALLATAAHAQFNTSDIILGHNKSLEYDWATAIPKGSAPPSEYRDHLFRSPDTCDSGNNGLRGLTFDRCVALCSSMGSCTVVVFYPVWRKGDSACFGYSGTNTTIAKVSDVADSATPVKLQDLLEDPPNQAVYVGLKSSGWGKNNYQNFLWNTADKAAAVSAYPLFTSSDPAVCDGDPDVGIPDLDLRECIDVCLSITKCLMLKFVPTTDLAGVPSRCYAFREVPSDLVKDMKALSPKLSSYTELKNPAYLGISNQYFNEKNGVGGN